MAVFAVMSPVTSTMLGPKKVFVKYPSNGYGFSQSYHHRDFKAKYRLAFVSKNPPFSEHLLYARFVHWKYEELLSSLYR